MYQSVTEVTSVTRKSSLMITFLLVNTREGVSDDLNHRIADQQTGLDLADAGAQRALTGGLAVSANQGGADRSGPVAGVRVREREENGRIWIGGLRLGLL